MQLVVSPAQLRATANYLADVSPRMWALVSNLDWGDISVGHGFAAGAKGYLAQLDWADQSIIVEAAVVDDYSRGLHTAANTVEQHDRASGCECC